MPKFEIDAIDKRILRGLQKNPRITNVELAEEAGISPSPCLRRVRRLHEAGVIEGYQLMLAPKAVGQNVQSITLIKLNAHGHSAADAFEKYVHSNPAVLSCYFLTGAHDVVLHLSVQDLDEFSRVVKQLGEYEYVRELESSIIIQTAKSWSPLPLDAID